MTEGHGEIAQPYPDCWRCAVERDERESDTWNHWAHSHMYVCPTCGNKRCPKATDHRLGCTGSNDPKQPGSRYGGLTGADFGRSGAPDA